MSTELLCAELVERYLRSRGVQYFRGQHDDAYFFILKTEFGPLHVHLELPAADGALLTVQVTPARFFPASERPRLARLAKRWNRRSESAKAAVYSSIDRTRIGLVAEGFVPMSRHVDFQQLARVADQVIASTSEFFAQLPSVSSAPLLHQETNRLPDAS